MKTFSKYELLEEIGKGPAGTTYRACDRLSAQEVIVKVLNSAEVSPEAKASLCRELMACSELQHPHIARILDIGEVEGAIYAATEFLHGVDLQRHLLERRELPLVRKLKLIAQVYDGLALAHSRQITHSNIKPGNIFLTDHHEIKILDFGIAKFPISPEQSRLPNYLAPEQITGHPGDARSDLYSVAVVLYELLFNIYPFEAPAGLIAKEIVNAEPRRLRKLDPQIPEELERVVAAALSKDPEQRPQTAEMLVVSLCAIAEQLQRAQSSPSPAPAKQPSAAVQALADTAEMPILAIAASASPSSPPAPPLAASATAAAGAGISTTSQDAERVVSQTMPQAMAQSVSPAVSGTSKPDAVACAAPQPALDSALWAGKADHPASEVSRLSDTPNVTSPPPPSPTQKAPAPIPASSKPAPVVAARPAPVRRGILIAAAAVLGIFIIAGLLSRQTSDATQSGKSVQSGQSVGTLPSQKNPVPSTQPSPLPLATVAVETPKPDGSADKMLTDQVDALWQSGQYDQAMKLVDAIIAAEPGNTQAAAWKKKIRAAQEAEAALK